MKRFLAGILVCGFVLIVAKPALCGEAIHGAFGQVLGKRFDPTTSIKTVYSKNSLWNEYKFDSPLHIINHTWVIVTPIRYIIYGIMVEDTQMDLETCKEAAEDIFVTLAKKYEGKEFGTEMLSTKDGLTFRLNQKKTQKRISVVCDGDKGLSIGYLDLLLEKQAKAEHDEWNMLYNAFTARQPSVVPRLIELADQNHPLSQLLVGFAYRQGIGVPKNSALGERYYEKAAKAGLIEAQFNLGTLYFNSGQIDKALLWLKSAAERGSTPAQYNLAQLYLQKGGHYDESAAFGWFLKAAEAGHIEAQYNTCHMYSAGDGVARNEVEAYKWCDIAATSSHEKATKNRDYIAKRMTPQQIERAKMLSRQWVSNQRR